MYTIENERLRVRVSSVGAELQSIFCKATRQEFLWQGDPAVWPRRAPLLFPFVGRLKDGGYTHRGKRYAMRIHGFAADKPFSVEQTGREALNCVLSEKAGVQEGYPFAYSLRIRYSLEGGMLCIRHLVENTGQEPLYFSIGAHPGFRCETGDELLFDQHEALCPYRLTDHGLLSIKPEEPCGVGRIVITDDLFVRDALIFKGLASRSVRLKRQGGMGGVRVDYGDAPCLGIWAKPGAPYVCIEPWFGVDDDEHVTGELSEKPLIQCVEPGRTFVFELSITTDMATWEE